MCDIKSEYILVLDFWIEIVKMQSVTSGEWGCPLDNDANSAMGQPNRSLKKQQSVADTKVPKLN